MSLFRKLPTKAEIKEKLWYDPETGVFRWRFLGTQRRQPWAVAGYKERRGYIQILIDKHLYMAHRLAWVYMTGKEPIEQIDHIDGNKQNNAWHNLRNVTNKQNCENRKLSAKNKTGVRGVYMRGKMFRAEVCHNYQRIKIGTFKTLQEAEKAVTQKRLELFTHTVEKKIEANL